MCYIFFKSSFKIRQKRMDLFFEFSFVFDIFQLYIHLIFSIFQKPE